MVVVYTKLYSTVYSNLTDTPTGEGEGGGEGRGGAVDPVYCVEGCSRVRRPVELNIAG